MPRTGSKYRRPPRYTVLPPLGGKRYGWRVKAPGGGWWERATKAEAVEWAVEKAKQLAETDQRLVQLYVHRRDGTYEYERTYPRRLDPREREG